MQPEEIKSSQRKKEVELPVIKVIGFDWDGTLVDSMVVKSKAFTDAVVKFYPQIVNHKSGIAITYIRSRGNPRVYQLGLIQEKFNLAPLRKKTFEEWSALFTSFYIDMEIPLFADTEKTLDQLRKRGYKLFLCSSVPQAYLDKTLQHYPIRSYFEYILGLSAGGKFRKGLPHLTYISKKLNTPLEKIAFVGDAGDDVKGANEAGCFSVGKMDGRSPTAKDEIERSDPKLTINSLEEILGYFQKA
ncbi:MAG: HAD family hydrolase [bacterium]|nr:HAD family hydrolase [bacterium]